MKTLFSKQMTAPSRKWILVDAEGKTIGRLATEIARRLSGRYRVDYTPHIDNGDYVVILNAEKIHATGQKESVKMYRTHSHYMGGLKETTLGKLREKNPTHIIAHAVSGMLPRTKHREDMMSRLKLVIGTQHTFEAQKPEMISL